MRCWSKIRAENHQSASLLWALTAITLTYIVRRAYDYEPSPCVTLAAGKLEGSVDTSRDGKRFYQFLGIPYAEAPTGTLRFAAPRRVAGWNGTLDATKQPPACKGFDIFVTGRIQGEESCLFLNVFTPKESLDSEGNPRTRLPVLFIIPGGGFHQGSTQDYSSRYFMDHPVVIVTINYRLGIFGFFSTNDDVVRGNMGLQDQVVALQWVQENIAQFGGDPSRVTIMGHSAGGISVHLHMLSKMSKGLFHRAITFGIVALFEVAQMKRNMTEHMLRVAEKFHCPTDSTKSVADCLRKLDADELARSHAGFWSPQIHRNPAGYSPSVEFPDDSGAFLTEHPLSLLEEGRIESKVPWMLGMSANEGLLLVGKFLQSFEGAQLVRDYDMWEEYLPHLIIYEPKLRPDAARKIRNHYFGNSSHDDLAEHDVINRLGNLVTEKLFMYPLALSAELHSKFSPVHLFWYSYEGTSTFFHFLRWASPSSLLTSEVIIFLRSIRALFSWFVCGISKYNFGVCHGDEMLVMYEGPISPRFISTNTDLEMSKLMIQMVVDFAVGGEPVRFNGVEWPPLDPAKPMRVMNLNVGPPKIMDDPFSKRLKFWKDLNLPWN